MSRELEREIRALVLAESDMFQVDAAASYLLNVKMNEPTERVLWTGLVVTYARPYGSRNGVGAIRGKLARPEDEALRALHQELLARRNDLFAHTDLTDWRAVVDVSAEVGLDPGLFAEEFAPMRPKTLPDIQRLAQEQADRFRRRAKELAELRAAQVYYS